MYDEDELQMAKYTHQLNHKCVYFDDSMCYLNIYCPAKTNKDICVNCVYFDDSKFGIWWKNEGSKLNITSNKEFAKAVWDAKTYLKCI